MVVRLWQELWLCGLGGSARGVIFPKNTFEIKRHQQKSGEPGSISPVAGENAPRPEKIRFERNKVE